MLWGFVFYIIWNRHGHECSRIWKLSGNFTLIPVHQKVSRYFGPRYIGDDFFFRAESSLIQSSCRSFIGVIVPYEISKVNFCVETKFLSVCQKRLNKLKNKWLLLHTGSEFQWYQTYERVYETSGSPLRFMLRRSSLVECGSVLHGTCLQSVEKKIIRQFV